METKNNIIEFWNWFKSNKNRLKPDLISEADITLLDDKILGLGDFSWEIREGLFKENLLIISSGGDKSLIIKANQINENAPLLEDWEFLTWKPKKIDWDYKIYFDLGDTDELIDISNWYYKLEKNNINTYVIYLKLDNISTFENEDVSLLLDMALESILGEEIYFKTINEYVIVENIDNYFNNIKLLCNDPALQNI
jgi:hypothetical protein